MKFRELVRGSDFRDSDEKEWLKIANPQGPFACGNCGLETINAVDNFGYLSHVCADEEVKVYNPKTGEYE